MWAALIAAVVVPCARAAAPTWKRAASLPVPRTEVAAARNGNEIVVVGGYLPSGDTTNQADAFNPMTNRWRRLPTYPLNVNHAAAATWRGQIVVAGGYPHTRPPTDRVYTFARGAWQELARMPEGRGAAGAAVVGDTLLVVGGIGPNGLAATMLALDLTRNTWRTIAGPTPREHLAVTATGGRVYALAGRTAGLDTNVRTLESWRPGNRRWTRHAAIPRSRGGTGAAAVGRTIVSVGGEEPAGTIRTVYAFDTRTRRWRRLADLP